MKKCKHCKTEFQQQNSLQKVCSWQCALEYARKTARENQQATIRKEQRDRKAKLKTRSQWLREAQAAFNAYIRERDKDEPCISCGRYHKGQYHAGHYRTTAAAPELRFSELNCHKQCAPCNNHLSGNIVDYRIRLKEKIGRDKLSWVEGPHEPQKWTIDDIKEIKAYFKQRLKDIKNGIYKGDNR